MKRLPLSRARLALVVALVALVAVSVPVGLAILGGDDDGGKEPAAGQDHSMHPVAGSFAPDETALEECPGDDGRCQEQAFGNLAFAEGPAQAMARFDEAIASDPATEANCHRIAHTIGSAALARYDGDVSRAFAEGSASCWSGYYHGILERAFTAAKTEDEVARTAAGVCEGPEIEETTFLLYQCVHGLGHGLMIWSGYDLPLSLSICDRLKTDWDRSSCSGGVFMENISSSYGVRSEWLRDDDPVFPCQVVEERHKLYCYLMVTSRVNELNSFEWADTAATCKGVEERWVETCFESYGRDASGSTRQDSEQIARLCRLAGRWAESCFYGAARDMTSNYARGEEAGQMCRLAAPALQVRCFEGIGTILGNLEPAADGRRAACERAAPPAFLDACVRGAGA